MQSTQRDQLIRQRAIPKGILTRILTYITTGKPKINELQLRATKLPDIYQRYDLAQTELETQDPDTDHSKDRVQFESQFYEVESKLHELLHPTIETLSRQGSPSPSVHNEALSPLQGNQVHIRLPQIILPQFDGTISNWLHFKDTFQSLIIDNSHLSNIQRYHYLISSLKDEAKQLIANLQITSDNFTVAWNLICNRYQNQRIIAMAHAKHLCNIPHMKKGDCSSMRQLINHVQGNLNALRALSLTVTSQDIMLTHLILASLDFETNQDWQKATATRSDVPSTEELISFLETRCRALLLATNTQTVRPTATPVRTTTTSARSSNRKSSNNSFISVNTPSQCILCNESHRLYRCDQFSQLTPAERFNHVKKLKLCFNCFQTYSRDHRCSNQLCHKCHKHHHTLLHDAMQRAPITRGSTANIQSLFSETQATEPHSVGNSNN
jgi:hypothetical protein